MPKMKSKRCAKKRFSKTGTGKVKHFRTGARHILTKKSTKRKRKLRGNSILSKAMTKRANQMINA
jgi:large subunit ribosomal protein L35